MLGIRVRNKALAQAASCVGLDVGSTGVRMVQLTRMPQGWLVERSAQLSRPAVPQGDSLFSADVTDSLRRCRSQAGFRGRTVIAALGVPDVEFHPLELPAVPSGDVNEVVYWEVQRLRGGEEAELETRHWSLPPASGGGPNAIAAAARRDVVLDAVACCHRAHLHCAQVDIRSGALARFAHQLRGEKQNTVWGVLDLGHRGARLVMCTGDVPLLVREVGKGGEAWTQQIAEGLRTSSKAAETHKQEHGIVATGAAASASDRSLPHASAGAGQHPREQVSSLLLGVLRFSLNELAAEIKRSYEYALSSYPSRQAGDLMLVGSGALMPNLDLYLSTSLGIPVRRASTYLTEPGCRLRYASGRRNPLEGLALSIGLAMADPTSPVYVNLIPRRVQFAQLRRTRLRRWGIAVGVSAAAVLVASGIDGLQRAKAAQLQQRQAQLGHQLSAVRDSLRSLVGETQELTHRLERANALRDKRSWSALFELLGACLPADCWLSAVSTDPANPADRGSATPAGAVPPNPVAPTSGVLTLDAPRRLRVVAYSPDAAQPHAFVSALKDSGVFANVQLERTQREALFDGFYFRFELLCEW